MGACVMSIYKQSQERAVIPFGISGEIQTKCIYGRRRRAAERKLLCRNRNGGRACVFFSESVSTIAVSKIVMTVKSITAKEIIKSSPYIKREILWKGAYGQADFTRIQ